MSNPSGSNADLGLRYPKNYLYGLNLAVLSNTTASLSIGSCLDSTNAKNMFLDTGVTIDFSVVGLNGIDTGAIGASKVYYVFLLSDSLGANRAGAIASLLSSPVLPIGADGRPYDTVRRVGWLRSDSSSHLITFYQYGTGVLKEYFYDTMIQVLNAGTATALTAIDLSSALPPVDGVPYYAEVSYTPATAGDGVKFAAFGSTATVIPGITSVVAAKAQTGQLKLVSKLNAGLPESLYINSAAAGSASAWVYGFVDAL